MSSDSWRPKVGEEVLVVSKWAKGPAVIISAHGAEAFMVRKNDMYGTKLLLGIEYLSPFPAPAAPRPAWEVLREAIDILGVHFPQARSVLRAEAARLEAAAAPKPPPTLAEAVRAYLDDPRDGFALRTLTQALARAEAEAGQ